MSTPPAPAPAPQPTPTPTPAPTPAPQPTPTPPPTPPPAGDGDVDGMVPRRRLNEVQAEARRLQQELETRETALRESQQRDENAVQRATRERDEARAAAATAEAALRLERHGSIFQRAALASATPVRNDALEAAQRLVNLDVCDTPEHAADAVTDLVQRYPFLGGTAEPTPPPRIGAPAGGASGGPGAPNGGSGQPAPTMEEARLPMGRWLAGTVLRGTPSPPAGQ